MAVFIPYLLVHVIDGVNCFALSVTDCYPYQVNQLQTEMTPIELHHR